MTNDPRDLSGKSLARALYLLGRNTTLRQLLIDFLISSESQLNVNGSVRDLITGPIVDALHDEKDLYEKCLADGTRIKFLFRTKIARDFLMAQGGAVTHVWEPQTTKLLLQLTKGIKGDVIVGGAYFGDQAVLVAKNILPSGGIVHCFEPNADQAQLLQENFALNGLDNIRIQINGLWIKSKARMRLEGFDSFANSIIVENNEEGIETLSIDDYQAKCNINIGLIQLDIEGAELQALKGAKQSITRFKPHIIFEIHNTYVDWSSGLYNTEICQYLIELGYTLFAIRDFNTYFEMQGKPIELIPIDSVYLEGPPHGFNIVAIQNPELFSNPCFKIVTNVSPKLLLHKDPALHHPVDGLFP